MARSSHGPQKRGRGDLARGPLSKNREFR